MEFNYWLISRIAIIGALFLASFTMLVSVTGLISYSVFLQDDINQTDNPEFYRAYQEFQQSPYLLTGLKVYNLFLGTGIIVFGIWLLRNRIFARRILVNLLGFDMVVTLIFVLWEAANNPRPIANPELVITLNTLQVAIIIALSHPKIVEYLETGAYTSSNQQSDD